MMKLEDMRKIAEARESMGVMNVSREAQRIYLDFVMLSEKTYLKLLTVAEAVKKVDNEGYVIHHAIIKALEELERE